MTDQERIDKFQEELAERMCGQNTMIEGLGNALVGTCTELFRRILILEAEVDVLRRHTHKIPSIEVPHA